MAMEIRATNESFHIGKNMLFFSPQGVVLQKTKTSKVKLVIWNLLLFATIGITIAYIVNGSQPLHWPPAFLDRLLLVVFVTGIGYFLFHTVRSTVYECKEYAITQNGGEILVNGKSFANQSQTVLAIKKKAGYKGVGAAYELQLKHNRKTLLLSIGNCLRDAEQVASLIGHHFGIAVKKS